MITGGDGDDGSGDLVRTSEEIYHQVRWDARLDPGRFVIGVAQRGGAGPKRIALRRFQPGGEIPWHRVLFIEADGERVWDRETGVDLVGTSQAGRVRGARVLPEASFAPRAPHRWDPAAAAWRPAPPVPAAAAPPDRVRVLTWNTLWDRYDSDRVETARRRPLLLAALAETGADVIALQEVEAALLGMLLDSPWVRARYTLATEPASGEVDDCGLLLLSRLPVREAGHRRLRPHKALGALVVDTASGPLVVAVTHLTSDHTPAGGDRRSEELAWIGSELARVTADIVLLGDFNDARDAPDGPATVLGLRDAWTEAHGPGDRTATFDPRRNPLAAGSSLTGIPGRLDRILLRGAARTESAALRGTEPDADGLHISDHYGVQADLGFTPAERG